MAVGDITVLDTEAFSLNSDTQACVEVRDGIIAIFYEDLSVGGCSTFNVDADGLLTKLDEQVLGGGIGDVDIVFDAIKIVDGIAAFTYIDGVTAHITTVVIAADGTITAAIIDTLQFAAQGRDSAIAHATGDFWAIMSVPATTDRAWLTTVEIDNAGNIAGAITDSQIISNGFTRQNAIGIIQLSDGIVAIFWGQTAWGFNRVETRSINGAGAIGAVIDTANFFNDWGVYFFPFHITGTIYGCAFTDDVTDVGTLVTLDLAADGTINDADIDRFTYAPIGAERFPMARGGAIGVLGVACFFYKDPNAPVDLATFCTVEIDNAGNIAAALADTVSFTPTDLGAEYTFLMQISATRYIGIWQDRVVGGTADGIIRSFSIEINTAPVLSTNPATNIRLVEQ